MDEERRRDGLFRLVRQSGGGGLCCRGAMERERTSTVAVAVAVAVVEFYGSVLCLCSLAI